jgi:hypothetical protein
MKAITKMGMRTLRRHPRRALRVSLFALKHRTAVRRGVRLTRRASQLRTATRWGADHPKVRAEAGAAVSAFTGAVRHARRAGVTNAVRDDQVATGLRQAGCHARKSVSAARRGRPKRRLALCAAAAVAGVAGAGCVGWRAFSHRTKL